jgi:hypothetical protein
MELLSVFRFAYFLNRPCVQGAEFLFDGCSTCSGNGAVGFVMPSFVIEEPFWETIPVFEGVFVESLVYEVVRCLFS